MEPVSVILRRRGIAFSPWICREESNTFGIIPEYYENLEVWSHEFTEESIWYTLRDVIGIPQKRLNSETIILRLPNGKVDTQIPSHVITALHTSSYFQGKMIAPEFYVKMLPWSNARTCT